MPAKAVLTFFLSPISGSWCSSHICAIHPVSQTTLLPLYWSYLCSSRCFTALLFSVTHITLQSFACCLMTACKRCTSQSSSSLYPVHHSTASFLQGYPILRINMTHFHQGDAGLSSHSKACSMLQETTLSPTGLSRLQAEPRMWMAQLPMPSLGL